jgi:hypothetical protein
VPYRGGRGVPVGRAVLEVTYAPDLATIKVYAVPISPVRYVIRMHCVSYRGGFCKQSFSP